jgi:hypothetical protein
MFKDERLRELNRRIAEESAKVYMEGTDSIPDLIRELQRLCPHEYKEPYGEYGRLVCSDCHKVFDSTRRS